MNKEQLRKNVNEWVRLRPIVHRLDTRGYPLTPLDDEWWIESVADAGVRISLPRTGHIRVLRYDQICEYTSDRVEGGTKYGFLILKVQLSIQGNDVKATPTRPGVAVPPSIPRDPLRIALLERLLSLPGEFVPAGMLTQFPSEAEGLLEARLLRGEGRLLDAVALQIKPRGVDWLQQQG